MLDERQAREEDDISTILSRREAEVLEMAARGMTNAQIAEKLSVSVHAVKFHLAAVYRKLRAANRTEAVVLYLRAVTFGAQGPQP